MAPMVFLYEHDDETSSFKKAGNFLTRSVTINFGERSCTMKLDISYKLTAT
jgi:hypothetical protein